MSHSTRHLKDQLKGQPSTIKVEVLTPQQREQQRLQLIQDNLNLLREKPPDIESATITPASTLRPRKPKSAYNSHPPRP